jgi:hypothetical protein
MGFSKSPQNYSKSNFLLFFLTDSQIWLILVIDDCQCGLHKIIAKQKKKKEQKICLSCLKPTINYYKVESKFYFLDEKNILLQLARGHYLHFNVQETILVLVTKLEVKRPFHHILYVFFK